MFSFLENLFENSAKTIFLNIWLSVTFLMSRVLKYALFVFLNIFLKKLRCNVYAFLSEKVFDLFIMALCSSFVINGDSFARIYTFSIGARLLKKQKIAYLKPYRSEAPTSNFEIFHCQNFYRRCCQ